jgi:TonB family protein
MDMTQGEASVSDAWAPEHAPYLTLVREKIRSHWRYPCVKDASSGGCEYRSASLLVEFEILHDGRVEFIDVRESSGLSPYDGAIVEAIKLASPLPAPPPAMVRGTRYGGRGVMISARVKYVLAQPSPR